MRNWLPTTTEYDNSCTVLKKRCRWVGQEVMWLPHVCHMSVTWPLAPPLTSLHFVQYYGLPLILCIGVWPWAGRTDKNLVISSCIPWRSAILSEMHNLNGISRAMTFRCMIQSLFCDVLKFDWHCNFLAKEKSLTSQKLPGRFSSYKWLETKLTYIHTAWWLELL